MVSTSTSLRLQHSRHHHHPHAASRIGKTERYLAWGMLALLLASTILMAWAFLRLPPGSGLPFPYTFHP